MLLSIFGRLICAVLMLGFLAAHHPSAAVADEDSILVPNNVPVEQVLNAVEDDQEEEPADRDTKPVDAYTPTNLERPVNDATLNPNNAALRPNNATYRPNDATRNSNNNAGMRPNNATYRPNDAKRNPNTTARPVQRSILY